MTIRIAFDNSYARLPGSFYAHIPPSPVSAARMLKLNRRLADELGLDADALDTPEGAEFLVGARAPEGAEPIAMAYAGHQFGNFVPQLGDGRAVLLGEVVGRDGMRRDIQLKGSGPTPFSRNGDGRAALGPVVREYIVSEAMAALGIPTTRALAIVATGEHVFRESVLPGAVLTRVASSHIRIGTFQYFAARGDVEALRQLADHAIQRHDPEAAAAGEPYLAFLAGVTERQATLVAKWMLVGFVHGVMNTDNMSVSGETIDYGPCAFMDTYDPATVFSSIDRNGRYAYANQPGIAEWNLTRLAECLLPLLAPDVDEAVERATAVLATFADTFATAYLDGMRAKLGLASRQDGDRELVQDLLGRMAANHADYTRTLRGLCDAAEGPEADGPVRELFDDPASYDAWASGWRRRIAAEPRDGTERSAAMRRVNPAYIPRNHRVEAAIEAAVARADFAPFEELITVLSAPFDDRPAFAAYGDPPPSGNGAYRTFCGT